MKSSEKYEIRPSPFVKKQFSTIENIRGAAILDIPSGFARNALFFQALGCKVVCVDIDFARLLVSTKLSQAATTEGRLSPIWIDLSKGQWPFRRASFTAIVKRYGKAFWQEILRPSVEGVGIEKPPDGRRLPNEAG